MLDGPPSHRTGLPLLAMQDVRKTFANGLEALGAVTLTLPAEPEFLAILGPSGCGKSTLLRIAAKLDTPSSGKVGWPAFDEAREEGQDFPRGVLGFVFQEPTLMPWANVFDNVRLPLRIKGETASAATDRVMAMLSRVGLRDFARAYPRELSGGMRMRASVARALVTEPRLLLMDEPFAALDEITRAKIERDLISLWRASRFTIVFVTHSVFEAVFLASRVIVMTPRPGRIAADLTIDAPYPRDEDYRLSAAYIAQCREVSAALARAMGEAQP